MEPSPHQREDLRQAYDDYYAPGDDAWRLLGARQKAQHILELTRGLHFNRVLEVGAGDGSVLHYLAAREDFCHELHAAEISQSGIEAIERRKLPRMAGVHKFDGQRLPFADQSFDLVILSHVLEHVEHPRLTLRELLRVAKFQFIEVPRDYKHGVDARVDHFLSYGHIDVYTPTRLRFLLLTENFEILRDKMSFVEEELLLLDLGRKGQDNALNRLKTKLWVKARAIRYALAGPERRETMVNAYSVLTRAAEKPRGVMAGSPPAR